MSDKQETRVDLDSGKYTVVFGGDPYRPLEILRCGETWMDGNIPGWKAWITAACEIEDLRKKNENLNTEVTRLRKIEDQILLFPDVTGLSESRDAEALQALSRWIKDLVDVVVANPRPKNTDD